MPKITVQSGPSYVGQDGEPRAGAVPADVDNPEINPNVLVVEPGARPPADVPDSELTDGERLQRLADVEAAAPYDPGAHSVKDVQAYLENATDDERARVLAVEAAGKARPSLLGGMNQL